MKSKFLTSFCLVLILPFLVPATAGASSTPFASTGTRPHAIAIDSLGNVYTTNAGSNNISKITPAGVSTIFAAIDMLPYSITVDNADNLYVGHFLGRVTKITPGGIVTILGDVGCCSEGLAVDSNGNVYVSNTGGDNVLLMTPAGVVTIFGSTGDNPSAIAIDANGNLYTANYASNNVTKITPAGVATTFGSTGRGPGSISIDVNGNIYTANRDSDNITKITPAGVATTFGSTGSLPIDIVVDASGDIYTVNLITEDISKITPAGVSTIIGTTGSRPYNMVIDNLENIYIANNGSNSVTRVATTPVIINQGEVDSAAQRARDAEREAARQVALRELTRTISISTQPTFDQFQAAEIRGVTRENFAEVTKALLALPEKERSEIAVINKMALKYAHLDEIAKGGRFSTIAAHQLTASGVIPAENRTLIAMALRKLPIDQRDTYLKIDTAVKAKAEALKARKARLAAVIARNQNRYLK